MTRAFARPIVIAAVLGAIAFAAVAVAQRGQGIARDEVVYMRAGARYWDWWADVVTLQDGALTESRIAGTFGGRPGGANNPEHPPLMKLAMGASQAMFDDGLGVASQVTASRLPSAAMFGLLVALTALFCARVWSPAEGAIAGVLMLLVPRAFFHAGLATFDVPVAALWFTAVVTYYRALRTRWGWVGFGVVVGLCLATKHNAIMLPAIFVPHYAWLAWRKHRHGGGSWGPRPLVFAGLLVVGPLVLVALWPWLWTDTYAHAREWIGFHLRHVHYNYEYLGRNYNAPPFPWHIAIVTTALTVPVITWLSSLVGAGVLVRRAGAGQAADPDRAPALLLLLSAGVSMGPFFLTSTPIFGATKHWLPATPTMCAFAAVGIVWAARRAVRAIDVGRRGELAAVAGLGACAALAALVTTVDAQPYALSHYNALAGGAPGGADLGMNRQFWGYAAGGVLPWLGAQPPGRVYTHDASPAWGVYREQGRLPPGFPDAGHEVAGIRASRYALVIHERHFNRHDYLVWAAYGSVRPAFVLTTDGVPIVSVYARE